MKKKTPPNNQSDRNSIHSVCVCVCGGVGGGGRSVGVGVLVVVCADFLETLFYQHQSSTLKIPLR